jgi:chloramphenicol 3-O phosphotransferase
VLDEIDDIILNGACSSGKSTLAAALQRRLDGLWFIVSFDHWVSMLFPPDRPLKLDAHQTANLVAGFYASVVAIVQAGHKIILDTVVCREEPHRQLDAALQDLRVFWVALQCPPGELLRREVLRGDRVIGISTAQTPFVHEGWSYDLEVDTFFNTADDAASLILAAAEVRKPLLRPRRAAHR